MSLAQKNYSGNRTGNMVELHTGEGLQTALIRSYGMEELYAKDIGSGRCGGEP